MHPSKFLHLCEINPEYLLEGLMLKLKLQYFGHLMQELTHWKSPDAGKDWGQEEKGATEDEMVGWHHRLNGHELGHTLRDSPGDGEGQGGLACCSPWGRKESDMTEWLNNHHHHRGLGPSPDLLGDENFTSSYSAILTIGIRNLFWAVTWKLFPCVESLILFLILSTQADLFYFPINCVFAFGIKLSTLGSSNWLVVTQRNIKKKKC